MSDAEAPTCTMRATPKRSDSSIARPIEVDSRIHEKINLAAVYQVVRSRQTSCPDFRPKIVSRDRASPSQNRGIPFNGHELPRHAHRRPCVRTGFVGHSKTARNHGAQDGGLG